MSYATTDELALALNRPFKPNELDAAQKCIDAAAAEIDHSVRRANPIPDGDPLANRVNVLRAVEWWKANDAAFGVIGFDQAGALQAPRNGFARHAAALIPLQEQFGVA